jgi:two-component SAPR family response regulator
MNPRIYNDFFIFHPATNSFQYKYNLKFPLEDIAFANSMVIEPRTREYYVLAFPIFRYESYLQLLKGKLDDPHLELAGNKIPYLFQDILSYADLYYCKSSKKLACVTLLNIDNDQTQVRIYTIGYPPGMAVKTVPENNLKTYLLWLAGFLFLAGISVVIFLLIKKSRKKATKGEANFRDPATSDEITAEGLMADQHLKNSILFFGDFQIFNKKGDDITNKFSHLLKELFLLIWFHSIKDKGISSSKITELLWFGKDEKSARNNLSVNIVKLKFLLRELETLELSRQTGYWKINFKDEVIYNDYFECLKISEIKNHLEKDHIRALISITQKGHFLESSSFEWLDEYKAEISNIIIDTLLNYAEREGVEADPDFILRLADSVLNFDMLSEEAIQLKCTALTTQGKLNLVKETFLKFIKDYKTLYNVEYGKTLSDLLKR